LQHQVGQRTSPNDEIPQFNAKTLPPGSAPSNATYRPNATTEVPGQALNEAIEDIQSNEKVRTTALSTFPGSTSADVHTGLGHPGQGQTSTELRHEGQHRRSKATSGPEGAGATGGSGLRGPHDLSQEFRRLQEESEHPTGPITEHKQTLAGAEEKLPMSAESVAGESGKAGKYANYSKAKNTTGVGGHGATAPRV
jgi:hypothetical protein